MSKRYLDDHYREHKNIDGNIVKITCFVNKITDSENDKEEIKSHRDKIYHENSEYVVGCELRNYVQHASLPVRTFTSGFRTRPEDNQNFAVFHVPLDKQALIDGGVKKNKLSNYGDKIDLHEIMDGYIYAISEMHLKSRSLVKNKMDESIEVINAKRRQVELEYDCLLNDIDVVDTEKEERLFSLNLEWFSVVKHLQSKNSHLLNFKRFTHRPYQQI